MGEDGNGEASADIKIIFAVTKVGRINVCSYLHGKPNTISSKLWGTPWKILRELGSTTCYIKIL